MMDLAEIRQRTLELLGDATEGSSTFAPNGDYAKLDVAIQWAQEQVAIQLGSTFYFEDTLPVVAQPPPAGMPTTPGAFGGVVIPLDSIELVRVAISDTAPPPPPPTSIPYLLAQDRASAAYSNQIFHLFSDFSQVGMWDGGSSDVPWATPPAGFGDNGSGYSDYVGIIATSNFVYLYGYVGGSFGVWRRAVGDSVGGSDWETVTMPVPTGGMTIGGHPAVAIDYGDNIYLLGGDNSTVVFWYLPSGGGWTAQTTIESLGEGFSPQAGLRWAGLGRTQLVCFDAYLGNAFTYSGGAWTALPTFPSASIVGIISITGADLWLFDTTGVLWPLSGGAWGASVPIAWYGIPFTTLFTFPPVGGLCFPATYFGSTPPYTPINCGIFVSYGEFGNTANDYDLIFDGSSFFTTDLQDAGLGNLLFGNTYASQLPANTIGSPGTGIAEMLSDGAILHSFANPPTS